MAVVEHYTVPHSLAEAARELAQRPATMFAGGTDLLPQYRAGVRQFQPSLININRLTELKGISESKGEVRIGTLTTITEILESRFLQQTAGVLVRAADCFACGQVRNAATLGGNICNASPAGDMIIPLLLLDAEVELACWRDDQIAVRKIALCDFFVGPGKTCMRPDEILTFIRFNVPEAQHVWRFRKFGTRPALDIAIVSLGIAGIRNDGCLRSARVAYGAVAPTPIRGRKAEAALESQLLNDQSVTKVSRIAREEISPISDVRASAWYRRELIGVLTCELLTDVAANQD